MLGEHAAAETWNFDAFEGRDACYWLAPLAHDDRLAGGSDIVEKSETLGLEFTC